MRTGTLATMGVAAEVARCHECADTLAGMGVTTGACHRTECCNVTHPSTLPRMAAAEEHSNRSCRQPCSRPSPCSLALIRFVNAVVTVQRHWRRVLWHKKEWRGLSTVSEHVRIIWIHARDVAAPVDMAAARIQSLYRGWRIRRHVATAISRQSTFGCVTTGTQRPFAPRPASMAGVH